MADEKELNAEIDEAEGTDDTAVEAAVSDKTDKAAKAGKDSKDAKNGKAGKKKGPGLGKRIAKYFRDLKGEFKKIIWPTFPTVVRNTGVTLVMCAIIGVVTCLIDFGLGALVRLMLQNG